MYIDKYVGQQQQYIYISLFICLYIYIYIYIFIHINTCKKKDTSPPRPSSRKRKRDLEGGSSKKVSKNSENEDNDNASYNNDNKNDNEKDVIEKTDKEINKEIERKPSTRSKKLQQNSKQKNTKDNDDNIYDNDDNDSLLELESLESDRKKKRIKKKTTEQTTNKKTSFKEIRVNGKTQPEVKESLQNQNDEILHDVEVQNNRNSNSSTKSSSNQPSSSVSGSALLSFKRSSSKVAKTQPPTENIKSEEEKKDNKNTNANTIVDSYLQKNPTLDVNLNLKKTRMQQKKGQVTSKSGKINSSHHQNQNLPLLKEQIDLNVPSAYNVTTATTNENNSSNGSGIPSSFVGFGMKREKGEGKKGGGHQIRSIRLKNLREQLQDDIDGCKILKDYRISFSESSQILRDSSIFHNVIGENFKVQNPNTGLYLSDAKVDYLARDIHAQQAQQKSVAGESVELEMLQKDKGDTQTQMNHPYLKENNNEITLRPEWWGVDVDR